MKCYQMTSTAGESTVVQVEVSPGQEAAARRAAENRKISYHEHFLCVARSDNGIDDNRFKGEKTVDVTPEMIVLRDDEAVGVYLDGLLFVFADPKTHEQSIVLEDKFVGGWGDVTETAWYELLPPEG